MGASVTADVAFIRAVMGGCPSALDAYDGMPEHEQKRLLHGWAQAQLARVRAQRPPLAPPFPEVPEGVSTRPTEQVRADIRQAEQDFGIAIVTDAPTAPHRARLDALRLELRRSLPAPPKPAQPPGQPTDS